MNLINIFGEHGWIQLWIWIPPYRWKRIKMYFELAELINIEIFISWIVLISIKLRFPFGMCMFGWSNGNDHRNLPYFDFKLFHQRKPIEEILDKAGWEAKLGPCD